MDSLKFKLLCTRCGHRWDVSRRGVHVDAETPKSRCPRCDGTPLVHKKYRRR